MRCKTLFLALALTLAFGVAQAEPPLADRIPSDAILYVGWAGRNLPFDGSMFGQMVNQPAMKEIVGSIRGAVLAKLSNQDQRNVAEHVIEMLSIAWQHRIALCATEFPQGATGGWFPVPSAALLIDLGKDRDAFAQHWDAMLALAGYSTRLTDAKAGSVAYKTFQLDAKGPVLAFGYVDTMFFVCLGSDTPAKLVALSNAADKSLLNSPKFSAAYKEVAGENEQFAAYMDGRAMADPNGKGAEQKGKVINALGLGKVKSIVSAVRVVDRGLYSKTRIVSPAPHEGVLMLLAGAPLSSDDLAIAPADADLALTFKMDPAAVLAEVKRVVAAIDEKAGVQLTETFNRMDRQLGLSLEKDLLAHVGDLWTLMSAPSLGGFLTGTALVVQLKDPASFSTSLEKLLAATGLTTQPAGPVAYPVPGRRPDGSTHLQTVTVGSAKITCIRLPGMPFAPAWAMHEGKLIVAGWPQVVQGVIESTSARLNADPAFQTAFKRIAGKPGIVSYTNLPKILREAYALPLIGWTLAANTLPREGIPARPDWLPSLASMEKYLWPNISAISADNAGITIEGFGSVPSSIGEGLNPAPTALAVSILLPSLGRARHLARESISMSNLKSIGTAIALYKAGHRQVPPPNLEALVAENIISDKMLISPLSGQKAYVYIRMPDGASGLLIQAYEDPATHGEPRTAVLFVDSHVKMTSVDDQFWDLVKKSKAKAMPQESPTNSGPGLLQPKAGATQ